MNFENYFKNNKVRLSDREILSIKIGGLITALRLNSNLSQAELAKKIGTKQPSIARAEKGEVVASLEFLSKIAKAVKTELIISFGFMEDDKKAEPLNVEYNKVQLSDQHTGVPSPYIEDSTNKLFKLNY